MEAGVDTGALYAKLDTIIGERCAISRCHSGPTFAAGLYFPRDKNFRDQLVNVPSCEYDRMMRIEPGNPEKSWLMVKLASDVYETPERSGWIKFTPEPGWIPSDDLCAFESETGTPLFGMRMPLTVPNKLTEDEIESFRLWIQLGAPAP